MKRSTITESQIVSAIKEYEAGKNANDICRELGGSQSHLLQLEEEVFRHGQPRA